MRKEEVIPVVGMGATMHVGSDSYPFTIIEVISPKKIIIQRDDYKMKKGHTIYTQQEYDYTPNPEGATYIVIKTSVGWKILKQKQYIGVGYRRAYYDPSF